MHNQLKIKHPRQDSSAPLYRKNAVVRGNVCQGNGRGPRLDYSPANHSSDFTPALPILRWPFPVRFGCGFSALRLLSFFAENQPKLLSMSRLHKNAGFSQSGPTVPDQVIFTQASGPSRSRPRRTCQPAPSAPKPPPRHASAYECRTIAIFSFSWGRRRRIRAGYAAAAAGFGVLVFAAAFLRLMCARRRRFLITLLYCLPIIRL